MERSVPRPLGLLPRVALSVDQLRSLQRLERYDLSAVRARLQREQAMPDAWLDEAILEFRRYIALRLLHAEPLVMFSKEVDAVWHGCLLFTRLYGDLCEQTFGCFLHHDPDREPEPDPEARWAEFADAYTEAFGSLHWLWQVWQPLL